MDKTNGEFQSLLLKAIGTRSQSDFAAQAELAPAHLNKMLKGEYKHTPTMRTLGKIASASDGAVTTEELAMAAGIKGPIPSLEKITHEERLKAFNNGLQVMASLAKGEMSRREDVTTILRPYTKTLSDLPVRGCHVTVSDAKPYTGSMCPNCDLFSIATASARDDQSSFSTYMVLYLIQSVTGGYFIVDIAFTGAALREVNALPHEIEVEIDSGDMAPEEVDNKEEITIITFHDQPSSGYSDAERALFRALVGVFEPNGVHQMYPFTINGFGFFAEDIDPDALHTFLENHDDSVNQIAVESVNNDFALLAAVLSKETDYNWDYFYPDENDHYKYNKACIVIDTESFVRYTDELIHKVGEIARMLGVDRFGTIMFTYDTPNYSSFRQYQIIDGNPKLIEDFTRDSIWTLFPEQPAKPGIYKVRDKYGRVRGAIFNGDWWSDLSGDNLYRPIAWLCSGVFEKEGF